MLIELNHEFTRRAWDKRALFFDKKGKLVSNLSTFMSRAQRQANHNTDAYEELKYIGDAFECFGEALIKLNSGNNQIGVYDYKIWDEAMPGEPDMGIDGLGKSCLDGSVVGVQMKFIGDVTEYLVAHGNVRLASFSTKCETMGIPLKKENRLVITTGMDIHMGLQEHLWDNTLRCINGKMLNRLVNGNHGFWLQFANLMGC